MTTQPTQVVQVAANTISGIQLSDITEFEFEHPIPQPESKLRKVDNGIVFKYGDSISDISFSKIPDAMAPSPTQNAYQWYCDMMTTGIANSVLGVQGAAYLKTIDTNRLCSSLTYVPAYECLRPNTKPWILFSDLDTDLFKAYDSVQLYRDMAARNFAYGTYNVRVLVAGAGSSDDSRVETYRGIFLAVPLLDGDISPSFFQGDSKYKFNVAFQPNQTITLFWPAYWIGGTSNAGHLAMAATEPTTNDLTSLLSTRSTTRSLINR